MLRRRAGGQTSCEHHRHLQTDIALYTVGQKLRRRLDYVVRATVEIRTKTMLHAYLPPIKMNSERVCIVRGSAPDHVRSARRFIVAEQLIMEGEVILCSIEADYGPCMLVSGVMYEVLRSYGPIRLSTCSPQSLSLLNPTYDLRGFAVSHAHTKITRRISTSALIVKLDMFPALEC